MLSDRLIKAVETSAINVGFWIVDEVLYWHRGGNCPTPQALERGHRAQKVYYELVYEHHH